MGTKIYKDKKYTHRSVGHKDRQKKLKQLKDKLK